ncbi:RNA 3'-terminal phosphate cyclase-like protein [Pancytospora philotis]|nr:RNA 3'-terminal phosphate cyclase-like protein [Pancytospora philotis]
MKTFTADNDEHFGLLLALSLLSKKRVVVPYPAPDKRKLALVDFLQQISHDSQMVVEGQTLAFTPGALKGGRLRHSTGYVCDLLAPIAVLAPFMQEPFRCVLGGTTHDGESSADMLKVAYERVFRTFEVPEPSFEIKRRGFAPAGEGSLELRLGIVTKLRAISLKELEAYDRLGGVVVTARVNANFTQRLVSTVKQHLDALRCVKISNVLGNKNDSGPSPGFECSVYALGKRGIVYSTLGSCAGSDASPESVAEECCRDFLKRLDRDGVFGRRMLPVVCAYMALAWGVSYLKIGECDEDVKQLLSMLKGVLGIEYYLVKESDGCVVKIIGCGFINPAKKC